MSKLTFSLSSPNNWIESDTLVDKFPEYDRENEGMVHFISDLEIEDIGGGEMIFKHGSELGFKNKEGTVDTEILTPVFVLDKKQIEYLYTYLGTFLKLNKDKVED